MSGGGDASEVMGGQSVVGIRQLGLGRDTDSGLEGGTDGRGLGDGWDGDRYGLKKWKDTITDVILGKETNANLSYAP